MPDAPSPDAPTEPSKGDNGLTQAARSLLTELQSIMLGDEATPDPEAMSAICVALDRFRAAGVREEFTVGDIVDALEGAAMNTDTDPRWLAATELRRLEQWRVRKINLRTGASP